MKILVAYASKYGSTKGIADFIGMRLRQGGSEVDVRSVDSVEKIEAYDAFVIGSAVFLGKWMKDAKEFLSRNQKVLSSQPVWLFSSGPLVTKPDKQGKDAREGALWPNLANELMGLVHAREHRVFFGALNPNNLSFGDKVIRMTPAAHAVMPEGDFRDWNEIEAWTKCIAESLEAKPVGARSP